MNSFYEHHKDSIRWHYRCFDRILLNGLIQPFQQPERVVGFFNTYRQLYPVTRYTLRDIADQFQRWVQERAAKRNIPIVEAPKGRRDEFVDPYFERAKPDAIVVILKAREPARIMTAIGDKVANRWHLQFAQRWVIQYNFYINDRNWGRMFVHSLTPRDLVTCGQKWLAHLTPFFTAREREHAGCQHRLFFSQVEYCDNLIFRRRAALDNLGQRLLDANRTIGQPNKITVIFGRKVSKQYRGKLQTEIEDMDLPNPVIRSHYRNGFIKQYVRDHLILRTEAASNNVNDYGVKKAVENLPVLQKALSAINDNYLNVQQDILETFVDRGQLRKLAEPTITSTGKRIPGLKLDHPRQLAVMHALVRFAHIAAGNTFTTAEIHPAVIEALGCTPERYTLASLRYDLSKLRAKGLVAKLPNSRSYQLLQQGYSICLVFLKLFERVYAPLTAGLLSPIKADARLESQRRSQLDRLYQRVIDDLDTLVRAVGLKAA